jgi:hypothetical protein
VAVDADGDPNAELSKVSKSLNRSSNDSSAYVSEAVDCRCLAVDAAGSKLAPLCLSVRLVGGRLEPLDLAGPDGADSQDLGFCD